MSMYFLPALAGLVFKLLILVTTLRGGKISILLLSLIVVFACHNAIELIGYIQFLHNQSVEALFRIYYIATIFLLMYVLLHGLALSRLESIYTTATLILLASTLSSLVAFTDIIIAGQYSIGYAMTAVEGSHYWLFSLYLLVILLCNIAALLYRYRSAASELEAIRCLYSLFALSPVMLTALLVTALKATDTSLNAAALGPISTALFLLIVLKGESKHKLSDIRRFLPFSPEKRISNNLISLVDAYVHVDNQNHGFKALQVGIEKEIILYTLGKYDNNITHAAEAMGLKNRTTLYSMMSRLDIDIKKLKSREKKKNS